MSAKNVLEKEKMKTIKTELETSVLSITEPGVKLNLCKTEHDASFTKTIEIKQVISDTKEEMMEEPKSDEKEVEKDLKKEKKEFELSDYVEHDKKYFFTHLTKNSCKLCSFKGKLIVQHYRMSHPESEVLISRIDPDMAETLIEDAIRNYEEYDKDHLELEKMTCDFKCPFCLMFIKGTANTFYNHISSHTGEYCFHCNHCSYWTYNHANIHSHLTQIHCNIHKARYKEVYPNPEISKYIFGYICSECNFIQLIRPTVEEHAMVYHPGTPQIYRVNLGMLLSDVVVDENCIKEIYSNENCNETQNHLKLRAEDKELSYLLEQMEELEGVKVKKIEPKKLEDDPHPIELTTFIYQPDLDIKQDSESNRTDMTQWIKENTRKAKTSIKLVNEMVEESNKIQKENKEEKEKLNKEVDPLEQLEKTKKSVEVIEIKMEMSENDSKNTWMLSDIPMTDTEKQNRKCPKAVEVMMKAPLLNSLYKCPKYECRFATALPRSFQKHFTSHHSILMDTLVPCLYCDYKVLCSSYVTHLEVKHGHCLFGCGNCFYRTTNSYFVRMHHELAHPNTKLNILQLELVTSNRIGVDTTPPNLSELVLPYNCKEDGFLSCSFKTLYFDEYIKHVEVFHQAGLGLFSSEHGPQEEVVLESWLMKEVGPFQCGYCKKATVTHQEMGRHQAVLHAQEQCLFYCRKFLPNDTVIIPEQVNLADPTFVNHLIQIPNQLHLCNFKLTDGLISSTSVKLINGESEVSFPLLLLPAKDTEIYSDQLDNDVMCPLDKIDSLEDSAHNITTTTAYKCKWKGCYQTYDSQTAFVEHIEKNHVRLQRGKKFTCFWIDCLRKSKPYTSKQNLLIHMRVHSGEKPYKCAGCNKVFSHLGHLKEHQSKHTREIVYLCQFSNCFKSFSHSSDRDEHQKTHYDTCKWKGCYQTYHSQMALVKHIEENHVRVQIGEEYNCFWINCSRNSKPFSAKQNLLIHVRIHSGEKPNKCLIQGCNKAFLRLADLRVHQRTHTGERPYLCQFPNCFKSFTTNYIRNNHQKKMHYNTKPYTCQVTGCSKHYTTGYNLQKHMKNHTAVEQLNLVWKKRSKRSDGSKCQRMQHDTEGHDCQVTGCSKKFSNVYGLRRHMTNHTVVEELEIIQKTVKNKQKEGDFVLKKFSKSSDGTKRQRMHYDTLRCKWKGCYQICHFQRTLVKHIQKNHVCPQSGGKKFTCLWINCSRKSKPFATRQDLSMHMRVHSGEKSIKCPFQGCNKTFSTTYNLKVHQRSHTGERPYLCQFSNCLKSFSTISIRNRHQENMHYNTEPYICQVTGCSKKYFVRYNFQNHMKKHMVDEQLEAKQKPVENKQKGSDFVLEKSSNKLTGAKHQRMQYDTKSYVSKHRKNHTVDKELEVKQKSIENEEKENDFIIYHL